MYKVKIEFINTSSIDKNVEFNYDINTIDKTKISPTIIYRALKFIKGAKKYNFQIENGFSFYRKFYIDITINEKLISSKEKYNHITAYNFQSIFQLINELINSFFPKTNEIKIEGFNNSQNKEISELINIQTDQSQFSDFQLAYLCGGMKEAKPRKLNEIYFNSSWSLEQRLEAKKYVEIGIVKYGLDIVNQCLLLNRKPFYLKGVIDIYSTFSYKLNQTITLLNNKKEEVKLTFETESIKIDNGDESLMEISKNGLVKLKSDNNQSGITLILLYNFFQDPMKQIVFFGIKKGRCSFCGRELNNSKSLHLGYGFQCAKNSGLIY